MGLLTKCPMNYAYATFSNYILMGTLGLQKHSLFLFIKTAFLNIKVAIKHFCFNLTMKYMLIAI